MKNLSIEAHHESNKYEGHSASLTIIAPPGGRETLSIYLGVEALYIGIGLRDPARMREIAQHLQGAAETLVECAEDIERKVSA